MTDAIKWKYARITMSINLRALLISKVHAKNRMQ